jgi:hypothetical protein
MVVEFTTTCAISASHHWSCEFEPSSWRGVLATTLCDKVCQWLATCQWFSPLSSTNKTNRHNVPEILLKVALNTTNNIFVWILKVWWSPQVPVWQYPYIVRQVYSNNISILLLWINIRSYYTLQTSLTSIMFDGIKPTSLHYRKSGSIWISSFSKSITNVCLCNGK